MSKSLEENIELINKSEPILGPVLPATQKGLKPHALTEPNTIAKHDCIELILSLNSKVPQQICFINRYEILSMYDILIIPAGCPHYRVYGQSDDYRIENAIHLFVKIDGFNFEKPIKFSDVGERMEFLFKAVQYEMTEGYKNDILVSHYIKAILISILLINDNPNPNKKESLTVEYIKNHYTENITLDQLMELNHVSKSFLCRHFKEMNGITIVNYINTLRIDNAKKQLITNRNATVDEIAHSVGFESSKYFAKVFRSSTSMSPSEFRSSMSTIDK